MMSPCARSESCPAPACPAPSIAAHARTQERADSAGIAQLLADMLDSGDMDMADAAASARALAQEAQALMGGDVGLDTPSFAMRFQAYAGRGLPPVQVRAHQGIHCYGGRR